MCRSAPEPHPRGNPRRDPRHGPRWAWLLGAAVLAIAPLASAGGSGLPAPLRTFDADYRVVNGSFRVGSTRIRLSDHADGWVYETVTEAEGIFRLLVAGSIRERVVFEAHDGRLRPLRYRHDEPEEADDVRVAFDWAGGEASVERQGETRRLAVEPDTRDPLSAMLGVMERAAAGERRIAFPGIDDEGEPTELEFEVVRKESIEVPLGTFEAWRVKKIRNDYRTTVTWLAPELGWLPVMIEQRRKGDLVARMELERLDGRGGSSATETETPR